MTGTVQRLFEKDVGAAGSLLRNFFKCTRQMDCLPAHVVWELLHFPLGGFFSDGWWRRGLCQARFEQGHEGAHLFYPFQCDLYWFRNLKGRDPVKRNGQDTLLLITSQRINLLEMWGSEPPMTNAHRLHVIRGVKTCQLVGLPPNYPPLGPYPIGEVIRSSGRIDATFFGFGVTIYKKGSFWYRQEITSGV